ncbi:hypothetical protein GDO86_003311 [Hymenochirus boettgeri]|uniref:RING-type E3 ubiquitin transferase n=1 Tax=Hymenochirus boettgeri TaxID=247094 RepID=A0A8T2K2X1_9PIPI|nr:hypothetical protein GDO86_003311 [Hymenochirus boettgeri]
MAAAGREGYDRPLCRAFSRGACRWGQNCRFSHERKTTSQICKHFQNGYCVFGDRCSYQHIPPPEYNRTGRRVSEPCILSHLHGHNAVRRGSEPSVISKQLSEMDKTTASSVRENWALAEEFIPRHKGLLRSVSSPSLQRKESFNTDGNKCYKGMKKASSTKTLHSETDTTDLQYELSRDVVCGICMDKVYEKQLAEERVFGILPNCNHSYCIGCIKRWRKTRDFQNEIIKGCPQCRIKSSYFIPNKYWIGDSNEKLKLVENFKAKTSKICCRFFVRGNGHCPFKSECIYLHELPNRPYRRRKRGQRIGASALTFSNLVGIFEEDFNDHEDLDLLHCALALALTEDNLEFGFPDEVEILWGECSDTEE